MKAISFRHQLYRGFNRSLSPLIAGKLMSTLKVEFSETARVPGRKRGWFHAASAGELESLWPLARGWDGEVILTAFSASADRSLIKLRDEISGKVIVAGRSPWEGTWSEALNALRPDVFITAKYEAWPDLWLSLNRENIPLVIIGAQLRKSLTLADSFCRWLGGRSPELYLVASLERDALDLSKTFPNARVNVLGEPRWDRVQSRAAAAGSSRSRELVERYSSLPRPWGVLGSIWPEDLTFFGPLLQDLGTVWIVPHQVESRKIREISEILDASGLSFALSSTNQSMQVKAVLVDEMGFLSELYSAADWAYVGGGFTKGVHSTIEPALHGIPIAVGPKRADHFPEIRDLARAGQLEIVRSRAELARWLSAAKGTSTVRRGEWCEQAQSRLGATRRILDWIADLPVGIRRGP